MLKNHWFCKLFGAPGGRALGATWEAFGRDLGRIWEHSGVVGGVLLDWSWNWFREQKLLRNHWFCKLFGAPRGEGFEGLGTFWVGFGRRLASGLAEVHPADPVRRGCVGLELRLELELVPGTGIVENALVL